MGEPCNVRGLTVVTLVKGFSTCISPVHKVLLNNSNDNKDIIRCEWTKELFGKSLDNALIKRVEEKYEELDGIEQGGIT